MLSLYQLTTCSGRYLKCGFVRGLDGPCLPNHPVLLATGADASESSRFLFTMVELGGSGGSDYALRSDVEVELEQLAHELSVPQVASLALMPSIFEGVVKFLANILHVGHSLKQWEEAW